jgi:hypothetical protein
MFSLALVQEQVSEPRQQFEKEREPQGQWAAVAPVGSYPIAECQGVSPKCPLA